MQKLSVRLREVVFYKNRTRGGLFRERVPSSGRVQEVKNNGKSLTVRSKKWSRLLTVGDRLLEVPTVSL